MTKTKRTQSDVRMEAAAQRRVHGAALGYQPGRMKPVHFAAGFLVALTGRQARLELLNKAAVPKAAPRPRTKLVDEYVADALLPRLVEEGRVSSSIDVDGFRSLRAHLNAAFNNDGAALGAAFAPYKTFGSDYSAPSAAYVSSHSKNHGHSGTFVLRVLEETKAGRAVVKGCRALVAAPAPPLADLGSPLLDDLEDPWEDNYEEQFGETPPDLFSSAAALMAPQTIALQRLINNLLDQQTVYGLRYMIIGLCSWLFAYMMRRGGNVPLLLMDAQQGRNVRIRAHSRASYSRQLDLFSQSYDTWFRGHGDIKSADWSAFTSSDDARQTLDDHFRDLGVRIGIIQPRAPSAKRKHVELQADTLRVLALSILDRGKVLTLTDFATQLRDVWCVCTGAGTDDGQLLREGGFTPLDADEDLQPNAAEFQKLLVRLGLAVEPSDGLTLCAIDAEDLI
jgi:hypothetical protein